ncbi:MAG: sll1863 family stress response protein [Nitrospirota bacterium]
MFKKLGIVMVCAAVLAVFSGTMAKAETPAAATQRQDEEKASEKRLADINKRMDELAKEIRKAEGKTQAELNRLYEEFKVKQGVAKNNLEELRKSTNETWDKAKANMDKALENLNGLYERSKAKLKGNKDEAK